MPKSQLEISIDKVTNENNVTDDWTLLFEIVDVINQTNGEKEALRLILKKLIDKDPHVVKHTLTLLDTCVRNCSRNFKLEVCSRTFVNELKNFILNKKVPKLSNQLAILVEKWVAEKEFKTDPALNLLPSLYSELKMAGVDFKPEIEPSKSMKIDPELLKKEEEELARAIQLSLKETSATNSMSRTPNNSTNSLFGSLSQSSQKVAEKYSNKTERRKVKALYDFEAVEDNEITFKAGDILVLTDDSDQNWWKGLDVNGVEGLFPSNFVTFDLNEKIENLDNYSSSKKVSFNDKVDVNLIDNGPRQLSLFIDEKKIDKCIELLQNSDPTGEIQPDTQELLDLEEECYMMGPLIDQKLQLIDQKHTQLEDLNVKIIESFQLYNNLMKESITKANSLINPAMNPMGNIVNTPINYMSAPPSIDQNSMSLANQLNSLTLNQNQMMPPQNVNMPQMPSQIPSQMPSQYSQYQNTTPVGYPYPNGMASIPNQPNMYINQVGQQQQPQQNFSVPNQESFPTQNVNTFPNQYITN